MAEFLRNIIKAKSNYDSIENLEIDFKFNTVGQDMVTPVTLTNAAVTVYKNDLVNGTSSGVTLSVNFNGITGLHHIHIDVSGAFYEPGKYYQVVLYSGTVDSVNIAGTVLREFSIGMSNLQR